MKGDEIEIQANIRVNHARGISEQMGTWRHYSLDNVQWKASLEFYNIFAVWIWF
jgi:hypothetical protein